MRSRAAAAGLALAVALVGAESAHACSCAYRSPEQQLKGADGAVVARLMAVKWEERADDGEPQSGDVPADFVYRVGRVYKRGPGLGRGRRLVIRSYGPDGCGLPGQKRRLYGLILGRENRRWEASLCSVMTPAQMRRAAANAGSAGASPSSPCSAAGAG